jgi:Tfp pilus assembly protein PilO
VKRIVEQLGLAGVLGIGVLLFCVTFHFSALRPAQDELVARHTAAAGASPMHSAIQSPLARTTDPLSELHSRFPALETLPSQVERIHRIARSTGLQLQQGDYRLEVPPAGLVAYRMSLPARGEYRALRSFIGAVLKEMPVAAVDRLRFERKKPGDSQLEAQIQLTLFFRPEKP